MVGMQIKQIYDEFNTKDKSIKQQPVQRSVSPLSQKVEV